MSLAIKTTYIRPDLETPFYETNGDFREYEYRTYIEPGHILFRQGTFSDDKLMFVTFIVFANRESRILYLSDESCRERGEDRTKYCKEHNITVERIYMID